MPAHADYEMTGSVAVLAPSSVRIEILPLKTGAGFFARLLAGGNVVEGPPFPTEDAAVKWADGRLGLRG